MRDERSVKPSHVPDSSLAGQALRQQLTLDAIVQNLPVALFAKDVRDDYRMIMWNHAAEKLFGIARESAYQEIF
jgi:PAS domain-containing protein